MATLCIQLNQDYKSFEKGFNCNLEGSNLIILSGVNGSGKSQLFDIILKKRKHPEIPQGISASIKLNGTEISQQDLLCRSFRENISINELTQGNLDSINQHRKQAWQAYQNHRLNLSDHSLWDYQHSANMARKLLIEKHGESKFSQKQITQPEFFTALTSSFIWKKDDIFTNTIGEFFLNHAQKILHAQAQAGITGIKFDPKLVATSPWEELNDLFSELSFTYRFKDNYTVVNSELNEQPALYPLKENGLIDESNPRKLADLSDGEKSIVSLSFASLSGTTNEKIKILLLDEFDATFNPSLTEMFYKVLDRYFISKGIVVIIATHSPATISLAPEITSFYELFKPNTGPNRILPVCREDYAELQIANRNFYTRINDQSSRIEELEKEKLETDTMISDLKASTKPAVFTEGPTDKIILLNGWSKLYPNDQLPFDIVYRGSAKQLQYYIVMEFPQKFPERKGLALFDFDKEGYSAWKGIGNWEKPEDYLKSYNEKVFAMLLLVPDHLKSYVNNIRNELLKPENLKLEIEHLFIKKENNTSTFMTLCPKAEEVRNVFEVGNKDTNFYQKITTDLSAEDFENFRPLFEKIKALLLK